MILAKKKIDKIFSIQIRHPPLSIVHLCSPSIYLFCFPLVSFDKVSLDSKIKHIRCRRNSPPAELYPQRIITYKGTTPHRILVSEPVSPLGSVLDIASKASRVLLFLFERKCPVNYWLSFQKQR